MSYKPMIHSVRVRHELDTDPDLSHLEQSWEDPSITPEEAAKYREQDAERLAAYNRGEWYSVGVIAEAQVRFATDQGGWTQGALVRTPGIWGVESDSDAAYFAELGGDELAELGDMLTALGLPTSDVREAIEAAKAEVAV